MPADLRLVIALALIALLGISTLAFTIAQPPQADNQLELPDLPDSELRTSTPEPTPHPVTQQRIRQALDGTGAPPSGDGMLDDVLQFIERHGSVLDGSELESVESELGITKRSVDAPPSRAHAAESLLKAARRLEKIEPLDKTRRDLVNQMRREAVRLLTQ